jgi:hypothetical protein
VTEKSSSVADEAATLFKNKFCQKSSRVLLQQLKIAERSHSTARASVQLTMKVQLALACAMAFMSSLSAAFVTNSVTRHPHGARTLQVSSSSSSSSSGSRSPTYTRLEGTSSSSTDIGDSMHSSSSFFGRATETAMRTEALDTEPTVVICLTGPRNCGTTTSLKQYMQEQSSCIPATSVAFLLLFRRQLTLLQYWTAV